MTQNLTRRQTNTSLAQQRDSKMFFQEHTTVIFWFSEVFLELFHQQLLLIFSSCKQLLHFFCALWDNSVHPKHKAQKVFVSMHTDCFK